jgi:putative membrane protein
LDNNTRLAVERNRLAYERTMMAWIRTGISLITFGFSIYKFFQIQHESTSTQTEGLLGSANFGLVMITIGLVALLIAALENRRDMNRLKAEFPDVHISAVSGACFRRAGLTFRDYGNDRSDLAEVVARTHLSPKVMTLNQALCEQIPALFRQ